MNAKGLLGLFGILLMAAHVGCCSTGCMNGGCGMGACGNVCDTGCCDHGPFHAGLLRDRIHTGVRSGLNSAACGEIYWDERINEPPVCDPCGACGEYTGESCDCCPSVLCRLRPLQRLRNLWGMTYDGMGCCECSSCGGTIGETATHCSSCGASAPSYHDAVPMSVPNTHSPNPATKPSPTQREELVPEPVPDSNARMRMSPSARKSLLTGSGVKSVEEEPMALNVPAKIQPNTTRKKVVLNRAEESVPSPNKSSRVKSRLVTNPN